MKTKHRIIEVDDTIKGHYYYIQAKDWMGIWQTCYFHVVDDAFRCDQLEWRCHTYEEARDRLSELKRPSERVVYED